jgi:hypothetical protein
MQICVNNDREMKAGKMLDGHYGADSKINLKLV